MSFQFDATLKDIVHNHIPDYAQVFGLSDLEPLFPLNVDLSTVSAATDIALGMGDPPQEIADLNFQANAAADLPRRMMLYNALLHYRYAAAVRSVAILLRPAANHPSLTGQIRYAGRPGKSKMDFRYEIVRMWEKPVKRLLAGGVGTLPLAVLGKLPDKESLVKELRPIVAHIADRIKAESDAATADKLFMGAYLLSGLRLAKEEGLRLFRGIQQMKESTTYQAIIEEGELEGRLKEAKRILILVGEPHLGKATRKIRAAINGLNDVNLLESLITSVPTKSSWSELLQTADS